MIALPSLYHRASAQVNLPERRQSCYSVQVLACGSCERQGRLAHSCVKRAHKPAAVRPRRLAAKQDDDQVAAQESISQSRQPRSNRQKNDQLAANKLQDDSIPTRSAVLLIQAYKDWISPVLPSVCRFQPSCSTYSIQAFQEFGPAKGITLMAWRILRCNPFRSGYQGQYDPPKWPPVGLERIFPS